MKSDIKDFEDKVKDEMKKPSFLSSILTKDDNTKGRKFMWPVKGG